MRRTRAIFLAAMLLTLLGVGVSYYVQRGIMEAAAPTPPKPLRESVQSSSSDWCYREDDGGKPKIEICARDMERVEHPSAMVKLRQVTLKLFHKDGKVFDRIKSASAEFEETSGRLFSDGEVEITLGVPLEGETPGRLLSIRSSGVTFDKATGKAATDRRTSFVFDRGDGSAVGATYDSATRELEMKSDVVLNWRGKEGATPMKIESGHVVYKEAEAKVYLSPWSRLTREKLKIEGGDAVATLQDGAIRLVEAVRAKGVDEYPKRQLAFGADELRIELSDHSVIEKMTGTGNASLEAVSASGRTKLATGKVDMQFAVVDGESVLQQTLANGQSVVESNPSSGRGARVLRSDVIETKMRAGGDEIESVITHSPADLELQPATAAQPRRELHAERLWLDYGARNQLKAARAVQARTVTQKPPGKDKKVPPPAVTTSKDLQAEFDERTGDLKRLEQWHDFSYEEGEQRATASKAVLDSTARSITLDGSARVWDASGSVAAARIVMNQDNGDFTAEQQVRSSRLPDKKPAEVKSAAAPAVAAKAAAPAVSGRASAGTGMLSGDEPMQATADRMSSTNQNRRIVYEGKAVLWQGGNRLQANRVVIDRTAQSLQAEGNVVSQFLDRRSADGKPGKKEMAYTTIRAASLDYNDKEKLAWYRGGVRLVRDAMDVKSRELRAWMKEEAGDNDSKLDRAFADGAVEIVQVQAGRTRKGTSEHAEYYAGDSKVILTGGEPTLVDSLKGNTRGRKLTYWANDDSLQVEGEAGKPAVSKIRRK